MPELPPLTALRAFEAAARYCSFTKAAVELCVSQSAVSRQIRYLEDRLGVVLFEREHRSLRITPDGARYFEDLCGLFKQMAWATERLAKRSRQEMLHLLCHTTFADRWLIPRLGKFIERHPEVDIRISASTLLHEPEREQAHAIITSSRALSREADTLFPYTMVPVCAPGYRDAVIPQGLPEELEEAVLIHASGAPAHWSTWLETCQMGSAAGHRQMRLETTASAITAASRGLGIAIASFAFVREAVENGTLVIPVPRIVSLSLAYCFSPVGQSNKVPAVCKFKAWLLAEAKGEDTIPDYLSHFRATTVLA